MPTAAADARSMAIEASMVMRLTRAMPRSVVKVAKRTASRRRRNTKCDRMKASLTTDTTEETMHKIA